MKKTKSTKRTLPRTIDQLTFARMIAQKFGLKLSEVSAIIEEEQRLTMEYVRLGYKVIKKNYLTIEGKHYEGKREWKSPLNGKTYNLEPQARVLVRVGIGFKRYISEKQMPDKLCRFVSSPVNTQTSKEVTA